MGMLAIIFGLFVLSWAITVLLMPRPKPLRVPLPAKLPAPRPEPPMEFDPLAFWLFPDWDGPDDEPFWMRPPKEPEPARHANLVNFSGFPNAPIPMEWGAASTGFKAWYVTSGTEVG